VTVPADLGQLATYLGGQAQSGWIELPSEVWPATSPVPGLINTHLGRPDLRLAVPSAGEIKPPAEGEPLSFKVETPPAGDTTFLGLDRVAATVCFTQPSPGGEFALLLTLNVDRHSDGTPTDWTFGTSYPRLRWDGGLTGIVFGGPELLFDTGAKKLTFSASLPMSGKGAGSLGQVGDLLGAAVPSTIAIDGEIDPGPSFELKGKILDDPKPLGDLISIEPPWAGIETMELPFSSESGDEAPPGKYLITRPVVGAYIPLGSEKEALALRAVGNPDQNIFGLEVGPGKRGDAVKLAQLIEALFGGKVDSNTFEEAFQGFEPIEKFRETVEEALAFRGLYAQFGVANGLSPLLLALELGSSSETELPILPGVLGTKDFHIRWTLLDPLGAKQSMFSIGARLNFGKAEHPYPFDLEATLPHLTVSGRYAGEEVSLSLKEVMEKLFGGDLVIPLEVEVEFTGLQFEVSPPAGWYTMTLEAGGDVKLFGLNLLAIKGGVLTVSRQYPQKPDGTSDPAKPQDSLAFHGEIDIGKLRFDVSAEVGKETVFSLHMIDQTLGGLLVYLVSLVDPYLDLRLEPPWDVLNSIKLDALSLQVNVTKKTVTVDYPIDLDLGFVKLETIGLRYQAEIKEPKKRTPSSLELEVGCSFLGQSYGGQSGKPPLGWNPVSDRAPAVPGAGAALLDLQYLALGQHVVVTNTAGVKSLGEVVSKMREAMVPLTPDAKDPAKLPGLQFDASSQWLIGAQLTVMGTVSVTAVFNDPDLAGIRVGLAGAKAGPLAGLQFEILYTRVTPTIGLYHTELQLPDAMRHLEFGAVSVTLPIIVVDVYTNGNFRVDLGFPKGLDFSRSFSIQVFPFVGYGGFYFAVLDGQTSQRVPRISDGEWHPVIEFGAALKLGAGKTIDEGVFSAGAAITTIGILQGVLAWYEPTDTSRPSARYHWVQGTVAVAAEVFGKVDFGIISVSIQVRATASVTVTVESYKPIILALSASVEATASIKIVFIRIHFSFSLHLNLGFTIGSASTPPWQLAPSASSGDLLQAQSAWRPPLAPALATGWREEPVAPLDFAPRNVAHLLGEDAEGKLPLDLTLVPGFTVGEGKVVCNLLPFAANSIPPEAHTAAEVGQPIEDAAEKPFNQFTARLFAWAAAAVGATSPSSVISWEQLERLNEELHEPSFEREHFAYEKLSEFIEANFVLRLSARTPGRTEEMSASLFPILPGLLLTVGGTRVDLATKTPVDESYQRTIDEYLAQLEVEYENAVEKADSGRKGGGGLGALPQDGTPSMATLVFQNYCTMLARAVTGSAKALLRSYPYTVPDSDTKLEEIAAAYAIAPASIVAANEKTTKILGAALSLEGIRYQVRAGDTADSIATAMGASGLAEEILALNKEAPVLRPGLPLTLEVGALGGKFTVQEGDSLDTVAAAYAVRSNEAQMLSAATGLAPLVAQLIELNPSKKPLAQRPSEPIENGTPVNLPGGKTRTAAMGDTLNRIAGTLLAPGSRGIALGPMLAALIAANPEYASQDPTQPLPAGTVLNGPMLTTAARPGETLTWLAASYGIEDPMKIGKTLLEVEAALEVGAVLSIPTISCQPGESDSLGGIAERFNLTVEQLAATIASTPGVFAKGAKLTLPQLPGLELAELQKTLLEGESLNTAAASVSRFMLHGLRLPTPSAAGLLDAEVLAGVETEALFALIGQQFATVASDEISLSPSTSAGWLQLYMERYAVRAGDTLAGLLKRFAPTAEADFQKALEQLNPGVDLQNLAPPTVLAFPGVDAAVQLPVAEMELSYSAEEQQTIATLEKEAPKPAADTLRRLPLYREVPKRWSTPGVLHWQAAELPAITRFQGSGPAAGEPTLWPFPAALRERVAAGSEPEPVYQLMTAPPAEAPGEPPPAEVGSYAWGTAIQFAIRRLPGENGPLANRYEVVGADADENEHLEALWRYLLGPGANYAQSAYLLYEPNPTQTNSSGLVSDAVEPGDAFLVKANLSTTSHSALGSAEEKDEPKYAYSASLADVSGFARLLWECGVVHSGGFTLDYATKTGGDLPEHLFAKSPEAKLTLLVLIDDKVKAPLPPPMRTVHNCAVALANVDPSAVDVFVQPLVHTVAATDTLTSISEALNAEYGLSTTPASLAVANAEVKGLLREGVQLSYGSGQTPPTAYWSTLSSLAAEVGAEVSTLGTDNAGAAILQPGSLLQLAPGELAVTQVVPPGNTGFRASRQEPSPPSADATATDLDDLFQLLAFSIEETTGFRASPEGLPAGPSDESSVNADGIERKEVGDPATPEWAYRRLLPIYPFAKDGLAATPPEDVSWVLPSPWSDPYRGLAAARQVELSVSFRDVYGNLGGKAQELPVDIGYFDDLAGIDQWPGVSSAYEFAPGGSQPTCELALGFDPTSYVAGPGRPAGTAARTAAVAACRYATLYHQFRQADVVASLTSSLDEGKTAYPLAKPALEALLGSVCAFLSVAEGLLPYDRSLTSADTLAGIAGRFCVSPARLAEENADVELAKLFGQAQIQIPAFYLFRHGDTLATAGLTEDQLSPASLDVKLNPGIDLSLKSQTRKHPLAAGETLRAIATAAVATAAGVAAANATAPLSAGKVLRVGAASVTTKAGDTLEELVPGFAPQVVTVEEIAVANQDTPDLFDRAAQAELVIADYLVQEGDTLGSLTAPGGTLSLEFLLADNQKTENVYPPGAALWESNSPYTVSAGDTLASVAAHSKIGVATLAEVDANQKAPLAGGGPLRIPAQVTLAGKPGSVHALTATETFAGVAAKFGVEPAALASLNRWTPDLFVAGTLPVAGLSLVVKAEDTFDTLFSQASGLGYEGHFEEFAAAAATALATTPAILRPGALLVCPPLSVGSGQTLEALAAECGFTTLAAVGANASLRGLLRPEAEVVYKLEGRVLEPVKLTADDTFVTLAARLTAAGADLSVDDLGSDPQIVGADILAPGAILVPPPLDVAETIPFAAAPENSARIFPLTVEVTLGRSEDLVDPDFKDVPAVQAAVAQVMPRREKGTGDDPARTLQRFAEDFEAAFPGLKAAAAKGGADLASSQLWAVDMRAGAIEFAIEKAEDQEDLNPKAAYFALPPLATTLLSYSDVPIRPYVSGEGLGKEASKQNFGAIDLDAWANRFLTAVDTFLSPAFAAAVRRVDAGLLDEVIGFKESIAESLVKRLTPVFSPSPAADAGAAEQTLLQELLISLGRAYAIDTVVQVPATVHSPWTDPETAPRLSGSPVVDVPSDVAAAGEDESAPYTLSSAKLPLKNEGAPLTFTFSAKQPAADRDVSLCLRYALSEIECEIENVPGVEGYQSSTWLTLLRPPGPIEEGSSKLSENAFVGRLRVPVPLRATPHPPTMVTQLAEPTAASGDGADLPPSPRIDQLKRWDYRFSFEYSGTDQDTRYPSVTFNGQPATGVGVESDLDVQKLFEALAQFTSVYEEVEKNLAVLPGLTPETSSAAAPAAVKAFKELVEGVAKALESRAVAALVSPEEALQLDYEMTLSPESSPQTLTLELLSPSTEVPTFAWPSIFTPDEKGEPVELQAREAEGRKRVYAYPTGVATTASVYEWRFHSLDVTEVQSAVAALSVTRNQDLGQQEGQSVQPQFEYETASEFPNPIVPLLVVEEEIPIKQGKAVAAALEKVFEELFGSAKWSADIRFAARYSYALAAAGGAGSEAGLSSELPIFLVTSYTLTGKNMSAFAAAVDEAVSEWKREHSPNETGGSYMFELMVFAAQSADATKPVLDLRNLRYGLADDRLGEV
jgi:LysM repeat protein